MITKRQSEQDFPRGSMRNGLIDGTKCQSEEKKGNFFLLLCIANTTDGSRKLKMHQDMGQQNGISGWIFQSFTWQWKSGFMIIMQNMR
jgi:hypothetical protein